MKRIYFSSATIRLLIVTAILLAVGFTFYLMAGLPRPDEANRVVVGFGAFSIVKPPDWDQEIGYPTTETVSLKLQPHVSYSRAEVLNAARIAPPTTQQLEQMSVAEFQGQKAWIASANLKWEFYWHMIFQRGSDWYDLALHLQLPDDVPKSRWWDYLNTFRAGAGGPTTRPGQPPAPVFPAATTIPGGFENVP